MKELKKYTENNKYDIIFLKFLREVKKGPIISVEKTGIKNVGLIVIE